MPVTSQRERPSAGLAPPSGGGYAITGGLRLMFGHARARRRRWFRLARTHRIGSSSGGPTPGGWPMAEFAYQDLLPLGEDATPYRRLTSDGVAPVHAAGGRSSRSSQRPSPGWPARPCATSRISSGPATSSSWRTFSATRRPRPTTGSWPSSSSRTRGRGGVLPSCQDTGTAIVMGKRRARPHRRGRRGGARAGRVRRIPHRQPAVLADGAPRHVPRGQYGSNLPAQIEIYAVPGDEYNLLFMAKGGGSANKSFLFQESKALLNWRVWPCSSRRSSVRSAPRPARRITSWW